MQGHAATRANTHEHKLSHLAKTDYRSIPLSYKRYCTVSAQCYSAPDFSGQVFGLFLRGPRSEGHDRGERAGARGRAAGAVECEGEDGRGAALVARRERGRGEPGDPGARA